MRGNWGRGKTAGGWTAAASAFVNSALVTAPGAVPFITAGASSGGFPSRYPHWRFGMEYEHLSKSYRYGLHRIYEMVINNDPCYAYLLGSNSGVDQKMVMAHVYAHSDFFKNNLYFAETHRKMVDEMGNHRAKAQRYIHRYGLGRVESLVDRCLSLENLINIHRPAARQGSEAATPSWDDSPDRSPEVSKIPSKPYMDRYINPKEYLEEQRKKLEAGSGLKIPEHPERDILLFLMEHAPLENWEKEILTMLREEAYYFAPQAATKILNEGWAAYWHSRIMTEKVLQDDEVIDYASHHASTVSPQPGKLNPYKIGMELLRDIERRWDRGQFGREYDECPNLSEKLRWDRKTGLGRQKIFEVRRLCNDLTLLDGYLTEDFCREQKLFLYGFNQANGTYEIIDRDFAKIKAKLLMSLANLGNPVIEAIDGNYAERGELCLKHLHEGIDLRLDWAKETLKNLHSLWKKPVHIETLVEGIPKLLSFDGEEHREQRLT